MTLEWEEGDHIIWREGLILILRPGESSSNLRVYFYDVEHQIEKFSTHTFTNCYGVKISRDQQWVIILDKNRFISKLWHLKTNKLVLIDPNDRRAITMVGTLGTRLIVSTYDSDFITSNVPFSQRQKASSKDFGMFSSASEETDDQSNVLWRRFRELREERDAERLKEVEEEPGVEETEVLEVVEKETEETQSEKTEETQSKVASSGNEDRAIKVDQVSPVQTPKTQKSNKRLKWEIPNGLSDGIFYVLQVMRRIAMGFLSFVGFILVAYIMGLVTTACVIVLVPVSICRIFQQLTL